MLRGTRGTAAQSFVRSEEVSGARQWSTEGCTLLALSKDGARQAGHFEKALGIGGLVAEKLEGISVENLASWLGHDIDNGPSGLFKFGRSKSCLNAKLFYRFHQGYD